MYMNKPILFHNKSLLLCASLIKNISYMEIHLSKKKKHQAENFIKCKKQYMYHMQQLFYSFTERKNKQNCP